MKKTLLLAPFCLLAMGGCTPAVSTEPVWQETLPETGAEMVVSNCTVSGNEPVYYTMDRDQTEGWDQKPALQTEGIPVVTLYGVQADQVELRFVENIDWLYVYYDKVMPQPGLDYIQTDQDDGGIQYRLDTVYNYEFVITTPDGTDTMIVTCQRDGL